LISAEELRLYRRVKQLFNDSRQSLGAREMMKNLREEGFNVGRYRTQTVMRKLGLRPTQRIAYKVTTKRKHSDRVADNLLNQNFNPLAQIKFGLGILPISAQAKGGCTWLL
jgi:putative transposase